jgi:hypothetical protein
VIVRTKRFGEWKEFLFFILWQTGLTRVVRLQSVAVRLTIFDVPKIFRWVHTRCVHGNILIQTYRSFLLFLGRVRSCGNGCPHFPVVCCTFRMSFLHVQSSDSR